MACFCLELDSATADPLAPQLLRALALLVHLDKLMPASCAAICQEVAGTDLTRALADVIAAIVIRLFNGLLLKELCDMGGITMNDLSQSVAYQEISGQGRQKVPIRALPPKRLAAAG
jgi:hypothetical protein